jgi:hypothetical protein
MQDLNPPSSGTSEVRWPGPSRRGARPARARQVPLLPAGADPRAQRCGRRWRCSARPPSRSSHSPSRRRPRLGHHTHLAGVYVAGMAVFAVLVVHQSSRVIWTRVPPDAEPRRPAGV